MGSPVLGMLEQISFLLGVVLAEPAAEEKTSPCSKTPQFNVCLSVCLQSLQRKEQPTVLSAGLKLGRLVLPLLED